MSSTLKKRGDIAGYVHSISQMKTSKTSQVQYFSALIQVRDKTWHVSSYSYDKHEQLMLLQASQQPVKITNAAFVPSRRRADTLDVFIDKRSEVEATTVDFPFTQSSSDTGGEDYTVLADVLKMQHRDKVSVCVKIVSEESCEDVVLADGSAAKRAIFRVADGSTSSQSQQTINISIFGKSMIKKIRNMPIARLKNMVVHVTDGQVSLSTHDNTSITSRKEEERCTGLSTCMCSCCRDPEVSSQMPCWYYEKEDLQFTASFYDGVDPDTEARYRREGARFILDTGTKMGLKFDSCATGVVYFHRFYMIHSFREFNRYVTGACCLFLAGKVEETPKKCKDIIKATREMLSENQFAAFGDDPKEEVMTLERILLQTIKFDLRVEHPYHYILRFAKQVKGEKEKVQKLIQMAWTFINDSMCTTLCLQWESDMIAVALMYLAGRLTKYEITDWHGKQPGTKKRWWDSFVEDATMDLLEDICHQVLDLYSAPVMKREASPPLPRHDPAVMMAAIKARELQMQQQKQQEQMAQQQKRHNHDKPSKKNAAKKSKTSAAASASATPAKETPASTPTPVSGAYYPPQSQSVMSAQNESSSFMSGEVPQSLRNLMGSYPASTSYQYNSTQYSQYPAYYTQAQPTQADQSGQTQQQQYYQYYQQGTQPYTAQATAAQYQQPAAQTAAQPAYQQAAVQPAGQAFPQTAATAGQPYTQTAGQTAQYATTQQTYAQSAQAGAQQGQQYSQQYAGQQYYNQQTGQYSTAYTYAPTTQTYAASATYTQSGHYTQANSGNYDSNYRQ